MILRLTRHKTPLATKAIESGTMKRRIRKVFGDTPPPVTSTKGVTGHLIGAAGATEAVACVLAMREGQVPPSANLERLGDDIQLDVVHDGWAGSATFAECLPA